MRRNFGSCDQRFPKGLNVANPKDAIEDRLVKQDVRCSLLLF